jgi:hypothetical protein
MRVKVLIPVYADSLHPAEKASLRQCLKVLGHYPIALVSHRGVNTQVYKELFEEAGVPFAVTHFDEHYFRSVFDYSRLLLHRSFYERFRDSDYLFIYQLDGFVFRDELEAWCDKGYDYIGAPWMLRYGYGYNGNTLWKVGNGGVSLRRTQAFLRVFDAPFPLRASWYFLKSIRLRELGPMVRRTLRMMVEVVLRKPTVEGILDRYFDERVNEDCFWVEALAGTALSLHIPDVITGAHFCVERKPRYVCTEILHGQLPFCCHAFEKYEYDFWAPHIEGAAPVDHTPKP